MQESVRLTALLPPSPGLSMGAASENHVCYSTVQSHIVMVREKGASVCSAECRPRLASVAGLEDQGARLCLSISSSCHARYFVDRCTHSEHGGGRLLSFSGVCSLIFSMEPRVRVYSRQYRMTPMLLWRLLSAKSFRQEI